MRSRAFSAAILVAMALLLPSTAFAKYSTRIVMKSSTLSIKTPGSEWGFAGLPGVPSATIKGTLQYYSTRYRKWIHVGSGNSVSAWETEMYDSYRISSIAKMRTNSSGVFAYTVPRGTPPSLGYCSRSFEFKYAGSSTRKGFLRDVEFKYRPYLVLAEQHSPQTIVGSHNYPGPTVSLTNLQTGGVWLHGAIYWPGCAEANPAYPYQLGEIVIELQRRNSAGGWVAYNAISTDCAGAGVWVDYLDMYNPISATGRYRLRLRYTKYTGFDSPGDFSRTLGWRYFIVGS
jgi:hypothetical protein